MAERDDGLDVELMNRVDFHPRGSWSSGFPAGNRISNARTSRQRSAPAWSHARRPHHIDHAGDKAEQKKHDETERRRRQQAVETPANHRSDNNAGDQLRRKPETARHRRGSGSSVSTSRSGLVCPDFAVVPNFGQTVIQTSEPCGKRSFVGRFIATSISAVFRAVRHVWRPEMMPPWMEITPRHPQKPRGPY